MGSQALNDRRANIDVVLTNLSIGIPTDQDFIGDRLLPALPQDLSTVKMPVYGNEAYRIREDRVGDYGRPDKLDISMGTASVEVDGHALAGEVSDRHQQESQRGPLNVDLEAEVLQAIVGQMNLAREKMQADLLCAQATYGANKTDLNATAGRWDDDAVDPLANLIKAIETDIPDGSGKRPNALWMGQQVWAKLIQNVKIKDRIYGTTGPQPIPTLAQVASLIGVDNVYVGRAVSALAPATFGQQGTITKLWGKNAGLLYVPPTAGKRVPAFGYTVEQKVFNGASQSVIRVREEMMGASGGQIIKRSSFYTPTALFPKAGWLFFNAVA